MDGARQSKWVELAGYFAFTLTWWVLFSVSRRLWLGIQFPLSVFILAIVSGYAMLFVYQHSRGRYKIRSWILIWIFPLIALLLVSFMGIRLLGYGDTGQLTQMLMVGMIWPRWLGGSAILLYAYRLWESIPILGIYADNPESVTIFIKVLGTVVMIGSSLFILQKWPGRMAVLLPMASPIYLLFCSGYDEYYPFIAGMYLLFLILVIENHQIIKSPYLMGLLLAALPVLYFPFLLISLIVFIFSCVYEPSTRLRLSVTIAVAYILLVVIFWPHGFTDYVPSLLTTLNTGDTNTLFTRYIGQSGGTGSVFFGLQSAISWEHANDLLYMFFWSGNMVTIILLLGCIYYLARARRWKRFLSDKRVPLLSALLIWQIIYFLFMLPKWGPRKDIDLFFSFYFALAFTAGYMLDFIESEIGFNPVVERAVISAVLGNTLVALFFLAVAGIPTVV